MYRTNCICMNDTFLLSSTDCIHSHVKKGWEGIKNVENICFPTFRLLHTLFEAKTAALNMCFCVCGRHALNSPMGIRNSYFSPRVLIPGSPFSTGYVDGIEGKGREGMVMGDVRWLALSMLRLSTLGKAAGISICLFRLTVSNKIRYSYLGLQCNT